MLDRWDVQALRTNLATVIRTFFYKDIHYGAGS